MPGPPFCLWCVSSATLLWPCDAPMNRLLEFFRRWATWPLAALGLVAWLTLLYFMVGDLL